VLGLGRLCSLFDGVRRNFLRAGGVLITADCLSEEKREGTLGLLFLTDLKGYDVVARQILCARPQRGLRTARHFPVLPCVAPGGVTAEEFWRVMLALLNVIFTSLTAGCWCPRAAATTAAPSPPRSLGCSCERW